VARRRPADPAPQRGSWFPLLVFGGLAALSLPLSGLGSAQSPAGVAMLTREVYPTVTQAMYLGAGFTSPPFPFPLGWYWVGALAAGLLLTGAWYRWRDRRTGTRTPLRGYLATGLVLAAVTAALPLLAWGTPVQMESSGLQAWTWLDTLWRLGTFALLAVAVGLAILARIGHSRGLAIVTALYLLAVCLAGWFDLQQAPVLAVLYPSGDPAALLPAAVLLLAGAGALLAARLHRLRGRAAPLAGAAADP
jgi:hypothetical protein